MIILKQFFSPYMLTLFFLLPYSNTVYSAHEDFESFLKKHPITKYGMYTGYFAAAIVQVAAFAKLLQPNGGDAAATAQATTVAAKKFLQPNGIGDCIFYTCLAGGILGATYYFNKKLYNKPGSSQKRQLGQLCALAIAGLAGGITIGSAFLLTYILSTKGLHLKVGIGPY